MKPKPLAFLKSIPHAYATVMFSDHLGVGLALMLLTLVSPVVGLAGLAGLIIGLLSSRILGFEGWESSSGVLGFNSLLIGLTLGYYYPWALLQQNPLPFLALLMIAAVFTQLLYVGLSSLTMSWFKMPSMSLAFSIAATLLWFYLVRSGLFGGTGFQKPGLWDLEITLPWYWREYFLSMANIVFVTDLLTGIMVALVLLFISRIGFMLSLLGWSICAFLLRFSDMGDTYGMFFPGFNMILIALTLGSVFLVPGKSSYLLAALGTAAGFLIAHALSGRYTFALDMAGRAQNLWVPMFAFPMNIVVILTVFALRLRLKQRSPVMNDYGVLHPEKALDAYLSRFKRFSSAGVPQIMMPVSGEWTITQGHEGDHTHKSQWAYAWDFEIEDKKGHKCSENEHDLRDYYCFGKPVLAAAAGYVAKVVHSIPDNPIGVSNTHDNWGNYISLYHSYGFYTLYAHLKEGSVKLKEGDWVKQGEKIGQVGSSGRSPVPHLHFHAQSGPDAGSATVFSHIVNYRKRADDGSFELVSSGVPAERERVSTLVPEQDLAAILRLGLGQEQSFEVKSGQDLWTETWKVAVDLLGVHRIESDRGTVLEFSIYNGIFNALNLKGRRDSALAAFALAASRLPWAENQLLSWEDEPALSLLLDPVAKNLALFLFPFFKPVRLSYHATVDSAQGTLKLESRASLKGLGMRLREAQTRVNLSRQDGILDIILTRDQDPVLEAKQILTSDINQEVTQ